jgi:hypothetical protein
VEDLPSAEYHAGVWLGLYQERLLDGDIEGLIFHDFSVYNVFVDRSNKEVIVLDPGMAWGQRGCLYEDVLLHVHSIFACGFRRRFVPFRAARAFLSGYVAASREPFDAGAYLRSLLVHLRRKEGSLGSHFSVRRNLFRIGALLTLPFYLIYVPLRLRTTRH